ncbi:hypothetical protein WJX74_000024 [Apatococcus lobatus]|uniref:Aminotransferase class I/classII large domain-containing protein n=1 Tax=Apatococcus lobatus TaxID=904363 RepID=A0AAW1QX81_9CHLO
MAVASDEKSIQRTHAGAQGSQRSRQTDEPVIVKTKKLMAGTEGAVSLAQGIVHWQPPEGALDRAAAALRSPGSSSYGPDEGNPELRQALRAKLNQENSLPGYDVHVTAGANQAFANVVLALLDPEDACILFAPYYFNHMMALQLSGGAKNVVTGRCHPTSWHPDLDWLQAALASPNPPRMVVITNPCNPTGVLMTRSELERASQLCRDAGAWLVMDNTYEHFVYDGREHICIAGPHILHIFSFSKAFGMMGWRVGYLAFPEDSGVGLELLKAQDTIPICAPQLSQQVALGALEAGRPWVQERLASVINNRNRLLEALSPLGKPGDGIGGGEGAIYLWARLPQGCQNDDQVVEWLVKEHGVCVIPGSSCGVPGYIRVAFANLEEAACQKAADRLKAGLQQLVSEGMSAVTAAAPKLATVS